ncbi:MAG: DUF4920 domain-containing protein [Chryseobacterium sp.]|nr:MAG: DUF4920 domain-containing protein [Chryseobacterium sp.]
MFPLAFFNAQPPAGEAKAGDTYGATVSNRQLDRALSASQLVQELVQHRGPIVTGVRGKVTSVCPNKGCWIKLDSGDNTEIFVKMKDYGFFVPTALEGKEIVMTGSAEAKTISVEEQRHYAEDAKKSPQEIAAITQPRREVRFIAEGIRVVD